MLESIQTTLQLAPFAPEEEWPGTQFEMKRPAKVSNLLCKILILPSKGSLISIIAQSKDSLRRGMEAPSPEVSDDFKGASFLEQLGEIESPRNNLEINLKEDSKVNFSNTFRSFSRLRSLFTTLLWSGL